MCSLLDVDMARSNSTGHLIAVCYGFHEIIFYHNTPVIVTAALAAGLSIGSSIITTIGNGLILNTLCKNRHYRSPPNLILAGLATTDFLVGIAVFPLNASIRIQEIFNIHTCILKRTFAFAGYMLCGFSAMTVSLVSIDRYLATTFPLRYKTWELTTVYGISLLLSWSMWLLLLVLMIFRVISFEVLHGATFFLVVLVILITAFCYMKICRILKKRNNSVADIFIARRRRIVDERRNACTVAIIVAAFLLLYLPKFASLVSTYMTSREFAVFYHSTRWADFLLLCNSMINPFIYVYRNPMFRQDAADTVRGFLSRSQSSRRHDETVVTPF